jgi:aspartyl protease family protein
MRNIIVFAGIMLAAGAFVAPYVERLNVQPPPAVMAAQPAAEPPAEDDRGGRTHVVHRDGRGHFSVDARVDGRRIGFMVDTGASVIALTTSDAARLGIRPAPRDFTVQVRTANGTVRAARTRLGRVEVGGLVVRDVDALIAPDAALSENLLGLSFLTRLRRFEYTGGKLVLEQ